MRSALSAHVLLPRSVQGSTEQNWGLAAVALWVVGVGVRVAQAKSASRFGIEKKLPFPSAVRKSAHLPCLFSKVEFLRAPTVLRLCFRLLTNL